MPSLTSLMAVPAKDIRVGEVVSKISGDVYRVKVQNQERSIKSAVPSSFQLGAKVLVTQTDEGEFIIGESTLTSRKFKEVIISG